MFHVAADTSVWARNDHRQTRINVDGTRHIVEAALARRCQALRAYLDLERLRSRAGRDQRGSPQLGATSWINYNRSKFLAEEEVRRGIARGSMP